MSEDTQQAEDALNTKDERIIPDETGLTDGHIGNNSSGYFKYKVKPKVSVGKLLKGDVANAFGKTSLSLEFGKEFEQDNVEIKVMVNGKLSGILGSSPGSDTFTASFGATKRF